MNELWTIYDSYLKINLWEGNFEEAYKTVERIKKNFQSFLMSPENRAYNLIFKNRMAQICVKTNKLDEAEKNFLETYKEAQQLTNGDLVDNNDLDEVYFLERRYDDAKKLCEEKLKKTNSPAQKARCYYHLGRILFWLGKKSEALSQWERVIEIGRKNQLIHYLFLAYNEMGRVYYEENKNLEKIIEYGSRALALAQRGLPPSSCGLVASNMGLTFNLLKKYHDAHHYLIYALRCYENAPQKNFSDKGRMVAAKIGLAEAGRSLGRLDAAFSELNSAEQILDDNPHLSYLYFWLYVQYVHFFHSQGNREKTIEYFEKAKNCVRTDSERRAFSEMERKVITN